MAELRTDDSVRRLRAVWLGPEGIRLPVDWTYVEWAGFLALLALLVPIVGLVAFGVTGDAQLAVLGAGPFGGLAAFYAMRTSMRLVDADRPVRYWRRTLTAELRQLRFGHGPADHPRNITAAVAALFCGRVLAGAFPGPRLFWFVVGCADGVFLTWLAFDWLRPRARTQRLARARAERTPASRTEPSTTTLHAPVVGRVLAGPWEPTR